MKLPTYQRGNQVNAWHVVNIVHLDVTPDALVPARLNAGLEDVGVVEVLHCFRAQIYAKVLQLGWLK